MLPILAAAAIMSPPAPIIPYLIGTYTSTEGSRGIYRSELNTVTGELSVPMLLAEASNPSFLAYAPDRRSLYSVHEDGNGQVSAFTVVGNGLRLLNTVSSEGAAPCHISVDPSGRVVLVANYSSGNVAAIRVGADGSLMAPPSVFQNAGKGPNASRQEGPHAHAIESDPWSRHIYSCDLGTDQVLIFDLNPQTQTLALSPVRSGQAPAGSGPRHLVMDRDAKFVYVNGEMSNTVTVFARFASSGALEPIQTLSTLGPDDSRRSATAEIALHPSGKWLYVSNRGADSIASFAVGADGKLSFLGTTPAPKNPRGFAIDPSGGWLVVGGQDSNTIVSMRIDPNTGVPQLGGREVQLSKPVCILF